MQNNMSYEWFEELVPECPLEGAFAVDGQIYYRLGGNPPTDADFVSHRFLQPDRPFPVSECQARSLSISDNLEALQNKKKLPNLKKKVIIEIVLSKECGLVKQTGGDTSHYSWWRSKAFNIQNCKVI